jgi:class 3 adenylate cyclase/HAMP domain-containing protein
MSQAQTPALAPAAVPGTGKKKAALRVSISFRFAFFTVLLIAAVMSAVGYSLFIQQRRTLSREVLGRGQTIAENLAASAREVMLQSDLLNLSILSKKAIQQGEVPFVESQYDLSNGAHLVAGLTQAFKDLWIEVPVVLARTLRQASGQAPLEQVMGADQRTTGIENEGIFEAIIVDKNGMVASHYKGTDEVNKPYKVPPAVVPATADTPFPVYEQELNQNGKRLTRRLFLIQQPMIIKDTDGNPKELGSVYLGMSEDLIARVVFQVTMKLAAIAIVAVAVGLLLTLVTVAWLTRPIGKLVSGVAAIAGGDFDTRLPVSSGDELGELTQSFNNMAVSLGQNAMLKGAFTRYVSDAALQQILSDPSKTGLHSQRVLATIYTSDMREFTSMSESLEPEQVVQVINTYLSCQTEIILKNGGVVDNFQGDATIGVWGKETPAPDDALKAVRAGFEVQEYINKLNAERSARGEVPKLFGLGINTGEVVSGNMGSSKKMKNTVIGEHVIFADKICNGCPGGKVWISESTYEIVKSKIMAEPMVLGPKSENYEGVKVYQVNGFK